MQHNIRQAEAKDLKILDLIHTENMKAYVEKNYSWNPHLFNNCFVPDNYQVIEIDNKIVGLIKVVFSEQEIYLAELQIAKDYQKQGIGTSLIRSVIQKARTSNKKLWLKVLKGNPAKKLYQRLGFIKQEESSTHEIMVLVLSEDRL